MTLSVFSLINKPDWNVEPVPSVQATPRAEFISELKVSVVIPTLNEAQNLPHVLPLIPKWIYEVILVDGLSTDNTVEVARQLLPDIRVVMQEGRGKGAPLRGEK
jgi:cellulose synthase/poly-beta-1,6-N-acetylglucosamine synthase-like glycosyltransferase